MKEILKWYNKDLEIEKYKWTYCGIASINGIGGDTENASKHLRKQ